MISKSASKKKRGMKELLTTQEMIKREIPMEKIRAVVARGQGVPDEDCPDVPSLVRFWIHTSNVQIDEDEEKQEQRVKVQANGAAGIDGVFATGSGSSTAGLGADHTQKNLEGLGKQPEGLISHLLLLKVYKTISKMIETDSILVHHPHHAGSRFSPSHLISNCRIATNS